MKKKFMIYLWKQHKEFEIEKLENIEEDKNEFYY